MYYAIKDPQSTEPSNQGFKTRKQGNIMKLPPEELTSRGILLRNGELLSTLPSRDLRFHPDRWDNGAWTSPVDHSIPP